MKLISKFKQAKRLRPQKTIGVMIESRGREIRMGNVNEESGVITVRGGAVLNLDCCHPENTSTTKILYVNNESILRIIKPNDVVYIDDGNVVCIILEISSEGCVMEVKIGGQIRANS